MQILTGWKFALKFILPAVLIYCSLNFLFNLFEFFSLNVKTLPVIKGQLYDISIQAESRQRGKRTSSFSSLIIKLVDDKTVYKITAMQKMEFETIYSKLLPGDSITMFTSSLSASIFNNHKEIEIYQLEKKGRVLHDLRGAKNQKIRTAAMFGLLSLIYWLLFWFSRRRQAT